MLFLDAQYDQFMKRLRKIRLDRLKKIFLLVDFAFVLVASIKAIIIVDNKLPVLFSFANEYLNYYTLTRITSYNVCYTKLLRDKWRGYIVGRDDIE